jgi:hypothetical protein
MSAVRCPHEDVSVSLLADDPRSCTQQRTACPLSGGVRPGHERQGRGGASCRHVPCGRSVGRCCGCRRSPAPPCLRGPERSSSVLLSSVGARTRPLRPVGSGRRCRSWYCRSLAEGGRVGDAVRHGPRGARRLPAPLPRCRVDRRRRAGAGAAPPHPRSASGGGRSAGRDVAGLPRAAGAGRGPRPSEAVVSGLARALRLTHDQRDHLFVLSGITRRRRRCCAGASGRACSG